MSHDDDDDDHFMGRSVPVWAFLLAALLGVLVVVGVAWGARLDALSRGSGGALTRAAGWTAQLPDQVKQVLSEVTSTAAGDAEFKNMAVVVDAPPALDGFSAPYADRLPGLMLRADPAAMAPGRRVLVGAFLRDGGYVNGAALLSPDLELERFWIFDEKALPPVAEGEEDAVRPENEKLVHGFAIDRDGSVMVTFDSGRSIQRFGWCGERIWANRSHAHHSAHLGNGTVWSEYENHGFAEYSVESGELLRVLTVQDLVAADPTLSLFEPRRIFHSRNTANPKEPVSRWMNDPLHFNDVEPLPAEYADAFPQFEPGDLLVSARSLNLIAVIDPDDLRVKWHIYGATHRQHDPDWQPDGSITVFNNRMGRGWSDILRIDPRDRSVERLHGGPESAFYSRIRGKHFVQPDGAIGIASAQQGRVYEVNAVGDVTFDAYSLLDGRDDRLLMLTQYEVLPEGYFIKELPSCSDTD